MPLVPGSPTSVLGHDPRFPSRIPTSPRGILSTAGPLPNPGAFASHIGGGGSGDCQLLADIPCNVVGGGHVNPGGERGVDRCCG